MAKLGSYYGLCPLIDHKSILGVSEDVAPGCVIVTLGKNMAIKYKVNYNLSFHNVRIELLYYLSYRIKNKYIVGALKKN